MSKPDLVALFLCAIFGTMSLPTMGITYEEQYRLLKAEKAKADADAKSRLDAAIRQAETDRDLRIYREFLKLHLEQGLERRLLKFTGDVIQKVNIRFGKKSLVVQVRGSNETLDVYANYNGSIPDNIKVGDMVTVSGMFESGTLTSVTLNGSSAVLKYLD